MRHEYAPRGGAKEAFESRAPKVLIHGPAGTGKTCACLEKVHFLALRYPGMRGLFVRKTQESLKSSALVTFREKVAPEFFRAGLVRFYSGSSQESAQYKYRNGSTITIGGMDKAEKIMSSEYDIIYVNEANELKLDDWQKLSTRLRYGRIPFQQLLADCNPDAPTHFLKQGMDAGSIFGIKSLHSDNPFFDTPEGKIYYRDNIASQTGVNYERLCLGNWAGAEGLIYPDFDMRYHVIDPFDIPADWRRWWAVDFGVTNPFVCQHWAENHDGELFLYREFYYTKRTPDEHAKQILSYVLDDYDRWKEPKPTAIITDHDPQGRRTLERFLGIKTKPADKTIKVNEGIQAVQKRIRDQRIKILRNCLGERDPALVAGGKPTCTAEEFSTYVWDENKEAPVKDNDHGMDATRYLVVHKDFGRRARVSSR